jgi:hypothetical protein
MPRNYSGIPFDPQIFFGAQANGFYGNVRFKTFGATRVFFFQIQPGAQNMNNYYTIIVVVPGKKTDLTLEEKGQLDIIMSLCRGFETRNSELVEQYSTEAVKFVNLATQYLSSQQRSDAWGPGIPPGTPVGMAVVFNQFDMGRLANYDQTEFPIAKLDFPQTAAASAAPPPSAKSAAKRKRGGKRRNGSKRRISKRKGSRKRKTIRRK